jgi:hypothetical protein
MGKREASFSDVENIRKFLLSTKEFEEIVAYKFQQ